MLNKKRNEVSYYPEIQRFIEDQIKSNLLAKGIDDIEVFWGIGELKTNLKDIVRRNPEKCQCVEVFSKRTLPLNLDIFALVTNGIKFELLILEVKLMNSAGLKEWSQLVGYCLVSDAKYGLLVNIDAGASDRLSDILRTEQKLSQIKTITNFGTKDHYLGFMQWDSLTQSFDYTNLGVIKSLSDLTDKLTDDFLK